MAWTLPKINFNPALFLRRSLKDTVPFDPETQTPVIRASICTGERVAGFKNKADGRFTVLISTASVTTASR